MRISPVSLGGHERTITLFTSMHGLLTVKLSHFAILSSLVRDDASGSLALESTSEVLLLLPSLSSLLITIKASTAGIATLQILSIEAVRSGTGENLALPVLLLARSNGMMQHAITLLIGCLIIAKNVRAGVGSRLALTNACAGTSESRSLDDFTLTLGTEDV